MEEREQRQTSFGDFGKVSAFGYTEKSIIFPLSSSEIYFDPDVANSEQRQLFKGMIVRHVSDMVKGDSKISIIGIEEEGDRAFVKIDLSRNSPVWWETYRTALHVCLESVQKHLETENFFSGEQFSDSPVGDYLRRAVAGLIIDGDPYQGMFRIYDSPEAESDMFFMEESHFVERAFIGEMYTRFEIGFLEHDNPFSKLIACSNDPVETAVTHLYFMLANAHAYKSHLCRTIGVDEEFGRASNSVYGAIHWLGEDASKSVFHLMQERGVGARSVKGIGPSMGGSELDVANMLYNIFKHGPKRL
ncbi:MAG: hypothetical protein RBR86_01310 [Pseudobdellovibrionaceae bacterium]|jgi:hypothetical protein|nr:hypothetical protein [Pseudobdellovibrionaceae bacterium]